VRRSIVRVVSGVYLMAFVAISVPCPAQASAGAAAKLSANSVALGSIVELRVSVRVPSGRTVYFPSKLPATAAIESHGAVRWTAEPAPGGATLKLAYPLLALGVGRIAVPGLDIVAGPTTGVSGRPALPGGSAVGAWRDAAAQATNILARVAPREVRSKSLFELEGVLGGVGPTPASDVVGRNWGTAPLALLLVSVAILVGATASAFVRFRTRPAERSSSKSPETDRLATLGELDALLARGLHSGGRVREFYGATSRIVRRHVERFHPNWGPNLTSTELMHGLAASGFRNNAEGLRTEMTDAERVKFGAAGAEAEAAEAHWQAVRHWIENDGKPEA